MIEVKLDAHIDIVTFFELSAPFFLLTRLVLIAVKVLLLQLVEMLVDFGARIEHPGAGTKKIFVVALMLELMVHDVKKDYEDFYNLLNVLLFFQLFLLVQFCVFLVHISEPLVLIVP